MNRIKLLKIKIKSLAEEQRIIKLEYRKERGWQRYLRRTQDTRHDQSLMFQMQDHRIGDLRPMLRAANIAYGLLRGLTIEQIESVSYSEPNWNEVKRLMEKYGDGVAVETKDLLALRQAA